MDTEKTANELEQAYRLLALCARAEGHRAFYEQLTAQVLEFRAWDILPEQAELHGMAPLLWHHLKQAELSTPPETKRILQGLSLRHRYTNQFHTDSLLDLTALLHKADIHPVVLKGLPLAHTYYPDPALRPMSDLDLLLPSADVLPALKMMEETGYTVRFPPAGLLPKELTAESPTRNDMRTHIELHHYDPKTRSLLDNTPDTEFEGFLKKPQKVSIQGKTVLAPDAMEHFHYLWRHLIRHLLGATLKKPLQLKWVADIISFVEHHAQEIDWGTLKRDHPDLIRRLEVFYSLSPMPPQYKEIIPAGQIPPLSGVNQYPLGWPQQPLPEWRRVGFWRFLSQTLAPPSNWWLKFYYGIEGSSLVWYGQVLYRCKLISLVFWRLFRLIGM